MDGKTIKFVDLFKKGKYKNCVKSKPEIVTPKEIFKTEKVLKSKQFSFKINPMPYWDKNVAIDARDKYLASKSWNIALNKIGKTESDLFPGKKEGEVIDFEKDVNINLWYDILPFMGNSSSSREYHKTVYELATTYTDSVVLPDGEEEAFLDVVEYIEQDKRYMSFIFNNLIRISEPSEEDKKATK